MNTTKLKSKNSYKYFLNNPEVKPPGYPPRIMRTQEVLYYLSTNINEFNKRFRPELSEIKLGNHAVGFDRLQIDALINQIESASIDFDSSLNNNMSRGKQRPIQTKGGSTWDENARQDSTNVEVTGTLIKESSDSEFLKILEQVRSLKRRNF
jgi:hypothetical protein